MHSTAKIGAAYFLLVFAAGVLLGTLRTFFVVPRLGALAAVGLELPFMLAISFAACRALMRRFQVPGDSASRFEIGLVAFVLLMGAELGLSMFVFHRTADEFFADLMRPEGLVGLAGQLVFAAMPLFAGLPAV